MKVGQLTNFIHQVAYEFLPQSEVNEIAVTSHFEPKFFEYAEKVEQVFNRANLSLKNKVKILESVKKEISQTAEKKITPDKLHQIVEGAKKDFCAIKIQSVFRMFRIKSRIIFPGQILPYLNSHLQQIRRIEIENLAKIVCREYSMMLLQPHFFKGNGIRVPKNKFPAHPALFISVSEDEKTLSAQVYGNKIGSGAFKNVKSSTNFKIVRESGLPKEITHKTTVLVRTKKVDIKDEKKPLSKKEIKKRAKCLNDDVMEGIFYLWDIMSRKEVKDDAKFKVAGIPDEIRVYRGSLHDRLEWENERFYSNVYAASRNNRMLALNEIKGLYEIIDISLFDKINAMSDVINTLRIMHKYGIIHRDLKPCNVLLKYIKQIEGFLIDFDITCKIGLYEAKEKYQYWDRCSEFGLALPTADLFGAVATLADFIYGAKFSGEMAKARKAHLFFEINHIIEGYKSKYILNLYNAFLKGVGKDSEQKKKEYEAEKSAIVEISTLIHDIYLADKELWEYMKTPEGGLFLHDIEDDSRSSVDKYKIVVQKIYERFPVFKDLEQRLSSIKEDLSKVKT